MHNRSFVTVLVHLVWATRRRQQILSPEHDPWLAHVLSRKCFEAGSQPFAIGIAHDHAHMAVGLGATTPLSELVRKLKGASSRLWNPVEPISIAATYLARRVLGCVNPA